MIRIAHYSMVNRRKRRSACCLNHSAGKPAMHSKQSNCSSISGAATPVGDADGNLSTSKQRASTAASGNDWRRISLLRKQLTTKQRSYQSHSGAQWQACVSPWWVWHSICYVSSNTSQQCILQVTRCDVALNAKRVIIMESHRTKYAIVIVTSSPCVVKLSWQLKNNANIFYDDL